MPTPTASRSCALATMPGSARSTSNATCSASRPQRARLLPTRPRRQSTPAVARCLAHERSGFDRQHVGRDSSGGELLLHVTDRIQIERALVQIRAIEALSIDPAAAAPTYWRRSGTTSWSRARRRRPTRWNDIALGCCARVCSDEQAPSHLLVDLTGAALLGASATVPVRPLVWNASASLPRGLYAVVPSPRLRVGDLVVVRLPSNLAATFDAHGYLPSGVPLLKRVAATRGATVCRTGEVISINDAAVATARQVDRKDRALPAWQGCADLQGEDLFLLVPETADSLDGRYLGVTPRDQVIGNGGGTMDLLSLVPPALWASTERRCRRWSLPNRMQSLGRSCVAADAPPRVFRSLASAVAAAATAQAGRGHRFA